MLMLSKISLHAMQCLPWASQPMNAVLASAHTHQQKLTAAAAELSLHDLAAHVGILGALATSVKAEQMQFMAALSDSEAAHSAADKGNQTLCVNAIPGGTVAHQ